MRRICGGCGGRLWSKVILCGRGFCRGYLAGSGRYSPRVRSRNAFRASSVGFHHFVRAEPEFAVLHQDNGQGNQQKNECDLQPAKLLGCETRLRPCMLDSWIQLQHFVSFNPRPVVTLRNSPLPRVPITRHQHPQAVSAQWQWHDLGGRGPSVLQGECPAAID